MFQAQLRPARLLKQIVDALKEVVVEVQFECSPSQMQVQAMDSSHVSLVALELRAERFHLYRCEKPVTLGINVGNLAKMLKCAGNDDLVSLKAEEDGDTLSVKVSDEKEERVSEFSMKLIEIDGESLGIPQQDYGAFVQMPSAEFTRICRDIASFGDTVTVDVKKDRVAFSAQGDIGSGKMVLKAQRDADVKPEAKPEQTKAEKEETTAAKEEAPVKEEGEKKTKGKKGSKKDEKATEEDEKATETAEEVTETKPKGKKKGSKKDEKATEEDEKEIEKDEASGTKRKVKSEPGTEVEEEEEAKAEAATKEEGKTPKTEVKNDDTGDGGPAKKRRRAEKDEKEEKAPPPGVRIECAEPVILQFALRYLTLFSKAQSVSDVVRMRLAKDVPLQIEYDIATAESRKEGTEEGGDNARLGTLRYYLAPKVGDEGEEGAAGQADDE